jgi:hypothetical protein
MDRKPTPREELAASKPRETKPAQGTSETARLFLDVNELRRRSPSAPPSRYVE